MSGITVDETLIIPMNQIYYNFIRPHLGLDGLTPAGVEGFGVNGSWEELLRRATKRINDS